MSQQDGPPRAITEYFKATPAEGHGAIWQELWGDLHTPWDRSGPSMALSDLLTEHPGLFGGGTSREGGKPKKALVPGCGRGHDVLLLSSFGYDVHGLDLSPKAVETAKSHAESVRKGQEGDGKDYGTVEYVSGDFFKEEWVPQSGSEKAKFDLIFDYTFFCAFPPPLRPAWAKRMSELLAPGGRLICLEFPTEKGISEPGPPWAAHPEFYVAYLSDPGVEPQKDAEGKPVSGPESEPKPAHALNRLAHLKPARTHAAATKDGRVQDWISVWGFSTN